MSAQTINIILNLLGVFLGGGALGAVLLFLNRRQELRDKDKADIRDHYADEVQALREANIKLETHFRNLIDDIEERREQRWKKAEKEHEEEREIWERRWRRSEEDHDLCKVERAKLREELDGVKAQLKMYSADQVIKLERDRDPRPPSERAPEAAASVERVKKIVEENGK